MEQFPVIQYFRHEHLPKGVIQDTSKVFSEVAELMIQTLSGAYSNHQEIAAGLRKLLEAKDCFVRAALATRP